MSTYSRVIVIEASTLCNLSCSFCAYDSRLKIKRLFFDSNTLRNLIVQAGRSAMQKEEKVLISWLGGEPLLHKDIFSITEEARQQFPLYFSATTNGTPLGRTEVLNHVAEHYSELTLSVDGFSEFHDRMRGQTGLFEDVKAHVKKLTAMNPLLKIRVNVVLMKENFSSFESLCSELSTWGIHEITFNQLGGRDRPEFYPENRLSLEQVEQMAEIVQRIRLAIPDSTNLIFNAAYHKRLLATANNTKLPIEDCMPGKGYMFISAGGTIAPCPYTGAEYGIEADTIDTTVSWERIPEEFRERRKTHTSTYCLDCPCTNAHGKFSE